MGYEPLDNIAHEVSRDDVEERKRRDREDEANDIRWLMGGKRGRRIVWRILEQTGVFRLTFNTNAMQMAFAEGNRNYGNRVLGMVLEICPEFYLTMVKEMEVGDDATRKFS